MAKKYGYNQVKEFFINKGWTLLSKKYKDNKQKLDVFCNNGHKLKINLNNFLTGWRCTECYGKRYLNYERVKDDFIKNGYILLSKKYINSQTKLKYQCPQGHISSITYNLFSKGHRCNLCSPSKKKEKVDIIKFFANENYKVLSKNIKNTHAKITVVCPNGHKHKTSFNIFYNGHRCKKCFHEINGKNHWFWKGGKPKCPDCGKTVSSYKTTRCKRCSLQLSFNPSWKGGLSFFPYPLIFNKRLKDFIRKRDNHTCQHCGKSSKKIKLDVHHIDYNKDNCNEKNLICLCRSCHAKSNYNRDYWFAYFTYIIETPRG